MVDDVQKNVKGSFSNFSGELMVSLTIANSKELKMVVFKLNERQALNLLKAGRVKKIGWIRST